MTEKGQTIISFSEENKQKLEENARKKKYTGRFRVTIDTYESPRSTLVSYYIKVEDFGCSEDVDIISVTPVCIRAVIPIKKRKE